MGGRTRKFASILIIHRRAIFGLPALLVLLALFPAISGLRGAETDPVREASKSVLRVVMASPSNTVLNASDAADVRQKGWCAREIVRNNVILGYMFYFQYENRLYQENWTGSAYLISSEGHWVTNHHVASLYNERDGTLAAGSPDARLFLVVKLNPRVVVAPAEVVWKHKGKDLAVIRSKPLEGFHPLPFADPDFIRPNLPVRSIGFPGASDALSTTSGLGDEAGYLSPKITGGTLSHFFRRKRFSTEEESGVWQHDAGISGGNSGGPLVNTCGQVIGTNAFGHGEWQLANGAIAGTELLSGRDLLPELRELGVSFTLAGGECQPPPALLPKWVYWSLGVLAALMAALFAGLLQLKSMLKNGRALPGLGSVLTQKLLKPLIASPPTAKRDLDGKNWKTDINGRWYRFDPVYGVVYRDDLPAAGPGLRLESDQCPEIVLPAGKTVVLGSSRDKAQVVIDSPYVSGAHVRLSNRDGRLMVEDLNSANGTFIGDRRLAGTAELEPGRMLRLTNRPGIAEYRLAGAAEKKEKNGDEWAALLVPQFLGAKAVAVSARRPVSIGRTGGNTVDLGDGSVSTRHCRVSVGADGRLEIEDLGSLNGTFIEGVPERIQKAALEKGQVFYVANKVYSFKVSDAAEEP